MSHSRADWIEVAWEALGEAGVQGVRVERLARKLGVTKGSFYWHFRNRQELIDALLDRWFDMREEAHQSYLTENPDPAERLWKVIERAISRGTRGQAAALRFWAQRNPPVAERIEKEDLKRLNRFSQDFEQLGFGQQEAETRAEVYSSMITAEFLRSGAEATRARLEAARRMHDLLVNGRGG
ncbi:MAG: TetR family transcriptional regulator [Alphaproteobacteria bacterium]|nr:TetR family transcriptional regulator [Alphaproteobacteria bacterium]